VCSLHRRAAGERDTSPRGRSRRRQDYAGARAGAVSALSFQRISFTSDLLPADIVGVTIYNQDAQEFEFISGPVFTNILLADEINRATPKSQSALLEAMSEGNDLGEKKRLPLPDPFLAWRRRIRSSTWGHIAAGVAARSLPDEADIGYPNTTDEKKLLVPAARTMRWSIWRRCWKRRKWRSCKNRCDDHVNESLSITLMTIVHTTRSHQGSGLGVSTRAR